jgi:hypothetical protein
MITRITPPKNDKPRSGDTIYIVKLKDGTEKPFGSIAAIYTRFTAKDLGIEQQSLYDYGIDFERPYENKLCTIKKDVVHRKKGNRKRPK